VKLTGWVVRCLGWPGVKATPGRHAIDGYLALSRLPGFGRTLDDRTVLLAERLSAILSGCRWCIDRTGHDWRVAGLPRQLLDQLEACSASGLLSERERAALAFVEAVAHSPATADDLERPRAHFSERELAELTAIVAVHHCLEITDPNLPAS
jgi:alkylhydroperoxidase family enzyme